MEEDNSDLYYARSTQGHRGSFRFQCCSSDMGDPSTPWSNSADRMSSTGRFRNRAGAMTKRSMRWFQYRSARSYTTAANPANPAY
jgi:hypothetical protein